MFLFSLYMLQSLTEFEITTDPKNVIGFFISLALFVALLIYMNLSKKVRESKVFKGEGVDIIKPRKPGGDPNFYKAIKNSGLNKAEAEKLEKILSFSGGDPLEILRDSAKMDACFQHSRDIVLRETPPENVQREMLEFFSIRNAIEYFLVMNENRSKEAVIHRFRRKQTNIACGFYLVVTKKVRVKFKTKIKLVLSKNPRHTGTMLNVSQSGCAIMAKQNIKADSFLKIEFNVNGTPIAALGKIRRLNRDGDYWIYHVKFLKLSGNSLIALNMFIFDYE
ncbi:MAG: PilZ domain-containing protein [Spirochaetaceae bacterium]|jgi:hypothetical protein|nr:PilZ domain-containing protein [Spirochaetaceae bacterium]